jgi:hypothetical protein
MASDKCYVNTARCRGGREGRHGPHHHRTSILNFIAMEKGFTRADFFINREEMLGVRTRLYQKKFQLILAHVLFRGWTAGWYRFCPVENSLVYPTIYHGDDEQENHGVENQSDILIPPA